MDNIALNKQIGGQHYKNAGCQVVELAVLADLNSFQFNIIKYVIRHRDKNGIEDLQKAQHYVELATELKPKNRAIMKGIIYFCAANKLDTTQSMFCYAVAMHDWAEVTKYINDFIEDYTVL